MARRLFQLRNVNMLLSFIPLYGIMRIAVTATNMPLTRKLLREPFDRRASALGKTFELMGLQETVGIYRDELNDHAAPPGIVERVRELFVSRSEKPVQSQITLMETARAVDEDWLHVVERAFTEPLERQLSNLAKDLPI